MAAESWSELSFKVGQVFTPRAPISTRDLFAGRIEQVGTLIDTISQTGYHAVLYGERGVGKTSLSNVLSSFMQRWKDQVRIQRVNCDSKDSFTTLWGKLFRDLKISEKQLGFGFAGEETEVHQSVAESLPETLTPDDVRRTLQELSSNIILVPVFDEFDRLKNTETATLMADTIKCLSDYSVNATIIVIGVAESVDELIEEHHSIERVLSQVPMPRMSKDEVTTIIDKGMERLGMSFGEKEKMTIVVFSQGLPYIAHLLSFYASKCSISRKSKVVGQEDVRQGIRIALEEWQQSIRRAYYDSTKSQQPGNIFKEVALACAFAETDEYGYFSAANVREPLGFVIPDRTYDIPHFARHLKELSGKHRGRLLDRAGQKRRWRYRFRSPLMRPYIIMRGFVDGLASKELLRRLSNGADAEGLLGDRIAESQS